MSAEPGDVERYNSRTKDPPGPIERELMDIDLDLDGPSWPFDPTHDLSNSSSPFLLSFFSSFSPNPNIQPPVSSSEQPSSPLWTFHDAADDKFADNSVLPFHGGLRFADSARFLSSNPDSTQGNPAEEDDKRRLLQASTNIMADDDTSDESCIIKERMTQALRYLKDSAEQHFLVQVWAPVKNGDKYVLTTSGQPFVLDPHSNGLLQYRTVSLMYLFSVDGESDGDLGLPGRVFRQKQPEWTPNVQYYSSKEYPRLNHALHYNVRGTLALPVFEPSGQSCIGVVELIMTSQKINYASEVDKVCKALEAVNLKSSDLLDHPSRQICNEGRQAALAEILEMLTVVCETHKLPLAQTWVPCRHRSVLAYGGGSKKSCTSIDGSCMGQVCMSTTDAAFYVVDAHMWGFRDACAEHHLRKGQGVAGRAFSARKPCFSSDITKFTKTEYPLVHYARMFGIMSCFAISLKSTQTGSDDYILEFFLPLNCKEPSEQMDLLKSISTTMRQCFRSLKASTVDELQDEGCLEVIETNRNKEMDSKPEHDPINFQTPPSISSQELDGLEFDSLLNGRDVIPNLLEGQLATNVDAGKTENRTLNGADGCQNTVSSCDHKSTKTSERRRGKTEKSISLEVLQQYFAGSLKDAAKSLGVCPTTMKRICRQHGISRWPSRKINKVNRSLSKLKRVIESVQGTKGAFSLASLTSPLPVSVSSITWPVSVEGELQSPPASKTSDLLGGGEKRSPPLETSERQLESVGLLGQHKLVDRQNCPQEEAARGSPGSKSRSGSGEESTESPISAESCQGSPTNEINMENLQLVSSFQGQTLDIDSLIPGSTEGSSLLAAYSIPDALVTTQPQSVLAGMLVEDSGSCQDFRDLCNLAAEGYQDEPLCPERSNVPAIPNLTCTTPHVSASPETRTVTIKATYKEDIIRFKLPLASGVVELKEEVSKRLKLEVGTFDIKYLDDDQEWVLLACEADLQECVEISKSWGGNVIRLLVHDITANFGSSCESTGE
ncbi:protein NLP6-like [Aristolochia californica]|uniref:protein NLP6-like n=1 Tax=Aristolochia californica TaxID=171875 RepID=UPI0035DF8A44